MAGAPWQKRSAANFSDTSNSRCDCSLWIPCPTETQFKGRVIQEITGRDSEKTLSGRTCTDSRAIVKKKNLSSVFNHLFVWTNQRPVSSCYGDGLGVCDATQRWNWIPKIITSERCYDSWCNSLNFTRTEECFFIKEEQETAQTAILNVFPPDGLGYDI